MFCRNSITRVVASPVFSLTNSLKSTSCRSTNSAGLPTRISGGDGWSRFDSFSARRPSTSDFQMRPSTGSRPGSNARTA